MRSKCKKEDENESKDPIEKERKEEAFHEEVSEEENPSEIGEDSNEVKTEEEDPILTLRLCLRVWRGLEGKAWEKKNKFLYFSSYFAPLKAFPFLSLQTPKQSLRGSYEGEEIPIMEVKSIQRKKKFDEDETPKMEEKLSAADQNLRKI
ncbi:hypothetical protein MTR_4g035895 [Medicago truncatula]|uniref:Uncharacterized protein n=1 Tax=Medicago truncatula TaxID=3880 RepID=A0A072UU41_MEDTR|nr:hypothetical protein MTR_4g035895 [Medicago truncatula]